MKNRRNAPSYSAVAPPSLRPIAVATLIAAAACPLPQPARAQQAPLTVQHIMQDPDTFVGSSPSRPWWSADGSKLYFRWNPQGEFADDSLFVVDTMGGAPTIVETSVRRGGPIARFTGWHHGERVYNADRTSKVFAESGDLYRYDAGDRRVHRLTHTQVNERNPQFSLDGSSITFVADNNVYRLALQDPKLMQLTDFRSGKERTEKEPDEQDAFLRQQQQELFEVLAERKSNADQARAARERDEAAKTKPTTYFYGDDRLWSIDISPSERFVAFIAGATSRPKRTSVQNYVTESGYAEELQARSKVGSPPAASKLYVMDLERDTTYAVDTKSLPGANDVPAFLAESDSTGNGYKRTLTVANVTWAPTSDVAVVEVRAFDNKDRWLARLDPGTGALEILDRQTDEAWIGGPGMSRFGGSSSGWMPDGEHFYFQSEETGFSHLYTVDVRNGKKRRLTRGDFEVFSPRLSKDGSAWYFTSSEGSPFERHLYRMPVKGGKRTRLTTMPGNNAAMLSPDEQRVAIFHSYSNRPPEVYLGVVGEAPERITDSTTEEWNAYPWRDPEVVFVPADDGVRVPARIYRPEQPNGAAVLFVHGAGYLQNVHKWWSSYFREYMFHNLLVDRGYVVLDLDYRGSAGYGRDWRTAIYRHMGGRDLQDYVDASRYVNREWGIDPERVFVYGGSYGGFITLMALFTEPEHFGGGAALRSVTDWAHYNHGYTSNILNTPAQDSLAFARSSPINFAEGLEDPLLIAHGVIDTNVQFQDVVRLAQRLIELGKEDWEMAIYPVEGHGFREPSSWTDEYRRILKLIEATVGPDGVKAETTAGE